MYFGRQVLASEQCRSFCKLPQPGSHDTRKSLVRAIGRHRERRRDCFDGSLLLADQPAVSQRCGDFEVVLLLESRGPQYSNGIGFERFIHCVPDGYPAGTASPRGWSVTSRHSQSLFRTKSDSELAHLDHAIANLPDCRRLANQARVQHPNYKEFKLAQRSNFYYGSKAATRLNESRRLLRKEHKSLRVLVSSTDTPAERLSDSIRTLQLQVRKSLADSTEVSVTLSRRCSHLNLPAYAQAVIALGRLHATYKKVAATLEEVNKSRRHDSASGHRPD